MEKNEKLEKLVFASEHQMNIAKSNFRVVKAVLKIPEQVWFQKNDRVYLWSSEINTNQFNPEWSVRICN